MVALCSSSGIKAGAVSGDKNDVKAVTINAGSESVLRISALKHLQRAQLRGNQNEQARSSY